jgi:hypothetical protein
MENDSRDNAIKFITQQLKQLADDDIDFILAIIVDLISRRGSE